jgi:uncharacterized protein YkuJ
MRATSRGRLRQRRFAEKGAADAVRKLFEKEGIKGIDVQYIPAVNKTP